MTDKKPRGNKSNLRPPWKPGQSGNPSGRPKRRPITDSYIEMADQELPPEMWQRLGMKPGSTFAHAVARGQFINAIKGDVKNASEIRQAIEGNRHPTWEIRDGASANARRVTRRCRARIL